MRTVLTAGWTFLTWFLLAALLQAAGETVPEKATTAQLRSAGWWLQAAVDHAATLPPQPETSGPPPRSASPPFVLTKALWLQAVTGDLEGALATAQRYAPASLGAVAGVQASQGSLTEALAVVNRIADAKEKGKALGAMADMLLSLKKPAEAERVLQQRPVDMLTPNLYVTLAYAQAEAGDLAGTEATIQKIAELPVGAEHNAVRQARALVHLAAAQARAGDREAYEKSLAAAQQLAQDNILREIARTQAEIGDYEAATTTLKKLDSAAQSLSPDLVLAAQVKRGDISPAEAIAKASRHSPVYGAVMEVQLAAQDHVAAAQTFQLLRKQLAYFSFSFFSGVEGIVAIHDRILDGFLTAGDVKGAEHFVEEQTEPWGRASLYGRMAKHFLTASDRSSYQRFVDKAIANARNIPDPRPYDALARPSKKEVLSELIELQGFAKDFEGAKKTTALLDDPQIRRKYEVQLHARELAAANRLEEAQTWVASLSDAQDRAEACCGVAMQLRPDLRRRW